MSDRARSPHAHAWFKSSYSGGNTTECVEVAVAGSATVLIRDSKHPVGEPIAVPPEAWADFIASLHGYPRL